MVPKAGLRWDRAVQEAPQWCFPTLHLDLILPLHLHRSLTFLANTSMELDDQEGRASRLFKVKRQRPSTPIYQWFPPAMPTMITADPGVRSPFLWVAGTRPHDPSPLPVRLSINRNVEVAAELRLAPRYSSGMWVS